MDNPYYIDENGILIKGEFYTGQTFTNVHEYEYYIIKDTISSITSVSPTGKIKDVII